MGRDRQARIGSPPTGSSAARSSIAAVPWRAASCGSRLCCSRNRSRSRRPRDSAPPVASAREPQALAASAMSWRQADAIDQRASIEVIRTSADPRRLVGPRIRANDRSSPLRRASCRRPSPRADRRPAACAARRSPPRRRRRRFRPRSRSCGSRRARTRAPAGPRGRPRAAPALARRRTPRGGSRTRAAHRRGTSRGRSIPRSRGRRRRGDVRRRDRAR